MESSDEDVDSNDSDDPDSDDPDSDAPDSDAPDDSDDPRESPSDDSGVVMEVDVAPSLLYVLKNILPQYSIQHQTYPGNTSE